MPVNIVISYSHKDESWKDRVLAHLSVLELGQQVEIWNDRRVQAGENWEAEIMAALRRASIVILLVSADFLESRFIMGREVPLVLSRRENEGLRVIPLIIRPCAWRESPALAELQARPVDGRPLSTGPPHEADEKLATLATEIASIVRSAPLQLKDSAPAGRSPSRGDKAFYFALAILMTFVLFTIWWIPLREGVDEPRIQDVLTDLQRKQIESLSGQVNVLFAIAGIITLGVGTAAVAAHKAGRNSSALLRLVIAAWSCAFVSVVSGYWARDQLTWMLGHEFLDVTHSRVVWRTNGQLISLVGSVAIGLAVFYRAFRPR